MKIPNAIVAACAATLFLPMLVAADSPLADAVERQAKSAFNTLLEQQADVNATQVDGMTALHWAAHHDDLQAAQAWVESQSEEIIASAGPSFESNY